VLKYSWAVRILSAIGGAVVKLIGKTYRFRVVGMEKLEAAKSGGRNVVLAGWHSHMLLGAYHLRGRRICSLASPSPDGEYAARIVKGLGWEFVRGDSDNRPARAIIDLMHKAKEGYDIAMVVDGPMGPAFRAKPGTIYLAQKLGFPIILVVGDARPKKVFEKAWDKFIMPYPFSKVGIVIGGPITVPTDAGKEEIAEKTMELEESLHRLSEEAGRLVS
jgi:lysophospholipid acyltransferase (LPLAT)-like uncharacterized protein